MKLIDSRFLVSTVDLLTVSSIAPLHRSAADADAEAEKSANGGRQSQGDWLGIFMFEILLVGLTNRYLEDGIQS